MVMSAHTHARTRTQAYFRGQWICHVGLVFLDGFQASLSPCHFLSSLNSTFIDFHTALACILHKGPFILLSVTCFCLITPTKSLCLESKWPPPKWWRGSGRGHLINLFCVMLHLVYSMPACCSLSTCCPTGHKTISTDLL